MINIFDIERYATKDGPGIRTVLFLKGCNLRCRWCQNPESQISERQVMFDKSKCSACGRCVKVCPEGAVLFSDVYGFITDHGACTRCGKCIDACFYDARRMAGREYSLEQIMEIILADKSFYDESGGGVTFSGGEPLLYHDDVLSIAGRCREKGIHTAVETAAAVGWEVFEELLDCIELFYVDLKHIDDDMHRVYTGVGIEKILFNITELGLRRPDSVIRIPVIPEVNHSENVMHRMLDFIAEKTEIREVELLPYHRLGTGKYSGLGIEYTFPDMKNVEKSECLEYEKYGRELGLRVRTGAV